MGFFNTIPPLCCSCHGNSDCVFISADYRSWFVAYTKNVSSVFYSLKKRAKSLLSLFHLIRLYEASTDTFQESGFRRYLFLFASYANEGKVTNND